MDIQTDNATGGLSVSSQPDGYIEVINRSDAEDRRRKWGLNHHDDALGGRELGRQRGDLFAALRTEGVRDREEITVLAQAFADAVGLDVRHVFQHDRMDARPEFR